MGEYLGEVLPELVDRGWVGRLRGRAGVMGKFVAAGVELVALDGQVADAVTSRNATPPR